MCVWHSSLLLRGGVHSVHVAVTFVRWEKGGASVCLSKGVVGSSFPLHPHSLRFRIRSFWTASVKPAGMHPAVFLTPEPSTAVFWVCKSLVLTGSYPEISDCCGTVILGHLVGHVYQSIYSFPGYLQQRLCISVLVGPFKAA